ncbi:MAG: serine/threonine protein phosphatase [Alphaproteobacteria bacterium]|nr:serine/threonine protein phosphatase [Alphaproteobacteria bacterium]
MSLRSVFSSLFGGRAAGPSRAKPRSIPPDTVVYAIGDIHGRLDKLLPLEGMIEADAARRAARRKLLVYLGDYVDRGPDSQGVIEHLSLTRLAGFEAIHLAGNHEKMMVDFLDDAENAGPWFANGGLPTLASYGLVAAGDRKEFGQAEVMRLRDGLRMLLPSRHRTFLKNLRFRHQEGDFLFVHAGIRPGIALDAQKEDDLLWIRQPFLTSNTDHGFVVVHGHTVTAEPEFRPNRIGIDTGAYDSGVLTALAIEGGQVEILQTSP